MKKIDFKFLMAGGVLCLVLLLMSLSAQAACSNPAGVEGNQVYNTTHDVMQFCDGSDWIAMSGSSGGSDTLASLSCADGEVAKWNNGGSVWECATDNAGAGGDNLGAGGTTTGTLYSQNGSGYGYFGSSSANYIRFDDAAVGNEAFFRFNNNWEYYMNATAFRPYVHNVNDLGASTVRWRDIWTQDIHTDRICNESGTSCKTPESLLASETDPQVSTVTNNKWCRGNGSAVVCDQDAPSGGGGLTSCRICVTCQVGFSTAEYCSAYSSGNVKRTTSTCSNGRNWSIQCQ